MRNARFTQAQIDFLNGSKNSEYTRVFKEIFEQYYQQNCDQLVNAKNSDALFIAQGMLKGIRGCINLIAIGADLPPTEK